MMGFFNGVRRVGVMPKSMRRNYATPASVRRHFGINVMPAGGMSNSCCVGSSLMQNPPLSTIEVLRNEMHHKGFVKINTTIHCG